MPNRDIRYQPLFIINWRKWGFHRKQITKGCTGGNKYRRRLLFLRQCYPREDRRSHVKAININCAYKPRLLCKGLSTLLGSVPLSWICVRHQMRVSSVVLAICGGLLVYIQAKRPYTFYCIIAFIFMIVIRKMTSSCCDCDWQWFILILMFLCPTQCKNVYIWFFFIIIVCSYNFFFFTPLIKHLRQHKIIFGLDY